MTKIGPAYRSRALQMTIFWRNKERWSKNENEKEEDNIWREKKKRERNVDGLGGEGEETFPWPH